MPDDIRRSAETLVPDAGSQGSKPPLGQGSGAGQDARDPLSRDLEEAIARAAGARAHVSGLRLLAGGASQEAWALDVCIDDGPHAGGLALVLRRDMGGALSSAVLTRAEEFAALRAVHAAGVPAPRPYWFLPADRPGGGGRAAFLMQRLDGETIGRRIVQDPALTAARAVLPMQAAEALSAIHGVDLASPGLEFLRARGPLWGSGQSAALAALELMEADLSAIDEPHPALEIVLRWLRAHDPDPVAVGSSPRDMVLVHGDFRVGNFMVGSDGLRGVLDWENVHVGDPHADLAWMCVRAWRFGMDSLPVGGIGERAPFFEAYTRASGRHVLPERVRYWEILGNVRWALGALGQARRHLDGLERSVELASLGRIAAEMELEALTLIEAEESEGNADAG
jgi:aminoglycoside phosphotransferase (APT) family kinase protein